MNESKVRILRDSFDLFLQKSFKEVTMQELARKTDLSIGAFYHYFQSKEQLFLEVMNHYATTLMFDYTKPSKESFYRFYHEYIGYLENDPTHSILRKTLSPYTLMIEAMRLFPDFEQRVDAYFQSERKSWEEVIHSARERDEISSPMSDQQIAHLFLYIADGLALQCALEGTSDDMPNALLALWDSLYQELKV